MPPSLRIIRYLVAASLLLVATAAQTYADQCPMAKEGKEDGDIDSGRYTFTWESWKKRRTSKTEPTKFVFGRCIENRHRNPLWTHWKGILASGWTDGHDRRLRRVTQNSASDEKRTKELWYGDNRDQLQHVSTTCWKDEAACDSPGSTATSDSSEPTSGTTQDRDSSSVTDERAALRKAFNGGRPIRITNYDEVFVPVSRDKPLRSLVRLGIAMTSSVELSRQIQYVLTVWFRAKDREKLKRFGDFAVPRLASLRFRDPRLPDRFREPVAVDGKPKVITKKRMIGTSIKVRQKFRNINQVLFATTSLLVNDFRGNEVSQVPMAVYMVGR